MAAMSSGGWRRNTGWSYEARIHELQKDFLIMARIIYKERLEGLNRLECIEGVEIDLLAARGSDWDIRMRRLDDADLERERRIFGAS